MATKLLFTPALTGALLFALTASPDRFRDPLLAQLRQYLSPTNISRAITTLKWLTAIGLVSDVNKWLTGLAQNNFRLSSEKHRYDWPREIAVITGATGGFGSLMSKELAAKGVKIMAVDLRDDLPADMKNNPKIFYYKCDITERKNVADLAQRIRSEHGDPSILINNAGISGDGNIFEQTQESLEKIFKINVISHYYTCQEFLPAMARNKKGHVVTIASVASFVTPPGLVPYANTKVAAWGFHDGVSHEARVFLDAPEIKFTCVHPTFANTPMAAPFLGDLDRAKAKVIKPELVSNAVVKQILSCRGKQIIIAPGTEAVVWLRSLPQWISLGGLRAADKGIKKLMAGMDKTKGK